MDEYVNEIGLFLDGKHYRLDGINGRFRYEVSFALYPSKPATQKIWHEPEASGRQSGPHRLIEQQPREHHITDLTNSERLCEIALELGFQFEVEKAGWPRASAKRVDRARGHVLSDVRSVGAGRILSALLESLMIERERARRFRNYSRVASLSSDIEQLRQVRLCS